MPHTVYQGAVEGRGSLFANLSFFMWEKVPTRAGLISDIMVGALLDPQESR